LDSSETADPPDLVHTDRLSVIAIYFDIDEGGDRTNDFISSLNLSALASAKDDHGLHLTTSKFVELNGLVNNLSRKNIYYY